MLTYPQFDILQVQWRAIAAEALALPRTVLRINRAGKTHAQVAEEIIGVGIPAWVESWGPHRANWLIWGLALNDTYPLGAAGAPATVSLLRQIKGIKVAAFSLFKPGVILTAHDHPEMAQEGLLTYHLGLSVPSQCCQIWSLGTFYEEHNGRGFVFPGGHRHYAFNASADKERIILYVEFDPNALPDQ